MSGRTAGVTSLQDTGNSATDFVLAVKHRDFCSNVLQCRPLMPGMRTIDCIMRQVFANAALAVLRSVARNMSDLITVKANNVLTVS